MAFNESGQLRSLKGRDNQNHASSPIHPMALTKKFRVGLLERIRRTPASAVPEDTKLDLCDYIALDLVFSNRAS